MKILLGGFLNKANKGTAERRRIAALNEGGGVAPP